MKKTVLLVDDDDYWADSLKLLLGKPLKNNGFDLALLYAESAKDAAEKIKVNGPEKMSLVISDGELLGSETAVEIYDAIRAAGYQGKAILFTCDAEEIGRIAADKNRSLTEMFFEQVNKNNPTGLVKTVLKVLAE